MTRGPKPGPRGTSSSCSSCAPPATCVPEARAPAGVFAESLAGVGGVSSSRRTHWLAIHLRDEAGRPPCSEAASTSPWLSKEKKTSASPARGATSTPSTPGTAFAPGVGAGGGWRACAKGSHVSPRKPGGLSAGGTSLR
jgi:hypothetical protein